MKQIANYSEGTSNGSEKWLLLFVVIVGLTGLLLTFSGPKEAPLELEGIQLDSHAYTPDASGQEEDYVLR